MRNPIVKGYFADPDIACFDGKYYIYPTTDGGENWEGECFRCFSSDDLAEWHDEGVILSMADVAWSGGIHGWAPAIERRGENYYFYFSGNKNIGVAVGQTPTGVFRDIGRPLVGADDYKGQMIDPASFVDDDGAAYLYWGNRYLYAARLKENMIELDGKAIDITPQNYGEAPCVFKRKGIYYFTWSRGDARSPEYHVRYGKSTSPMEIPEGDGVILSRDYTEDKRIHGTGHHSIVNVPGTDDWYIVYHRFDIERFGDLTEYSTEAGNHRELCIDKLEFDEQGNILPIYATR